MVTTDTLSDEDRLSARPNATSRLTARISGLTDAVQRRLAGRYAALALAIVTVLWIVHFSKLVRLRNTNFNAFDFDMGIYAQAVWLLAHGRHFMTVRGLPVFGSHVNVLLYAFVPLSWLGLASPTVMSVIQVISLGLGTVPIYLIARRRTGNPWIGTVLGIAYLAHPSTQWMAWELFHPDAMAVLPLLFAFYFMTEKRWRPFAICLVVAMLWKEDVAITAFMLGVVLLVQGHRKIAVRTMVGAVLWFVIATQVIIPRSLGGSQPFYADGFYGDLGTSSSQIVKNAIVHPGRVYEHLDNANAARYATQLGTPYAFLPYASPMFLIGLPNSIINLLSTEAFVWDDHFHYIALPLFATTVSMIEAVGYIHRRRRDAAVFAVAAVLGCAMLTTGQRGLSKLAVDYAGGIWPLKVGSVQEARQAVVDQTRDGAAVSATLHLVPPLSQRAEIYTFPNPWQPVNWGVSSSATRDPARIDSLAIDVNDLGAARSIYDCLIDTGVFHIEYEREGIVLATRAPGVADTCGPAR